MGTRLEPNNPFPFLLGPPWASLSLQQLIGSMAGWADIGYCPIDIPVVGRTDIGHPTYFLWRAQVTPASPGAPEVG